MEFVGREDGAEHGVERPVEGAEAGEVVDLGVVGRAGETEGGGKLGGHGSVEAGRPGCVVGEEGHDGGLRPGYEGIGAGGLCVGGEALEGFVRGRGTYEGDGGRRGG